MTSTKSPYLLTMINWTIFDALVLDFPILPVVNVAAMTYLPPLRYLILTRFIVFCFLHILVILCFILCFIFRFSYLSFIFVAVLNLFFSVVSLAIIFLNSFDIFCFEFTFSFKSDMVFFFCLFVLCFPFFELLPH